MTLVETILKKYLNNLFSLVFLFSKDISVFEKKKNFEKLYMS